MAEGNSTAIDPMHVAHLHVLTCRAIPVRPRRHVPTVVSSPRALYAAFPGATRPRTDPQRQHGLATRPRYLLVACRAGILCPARQSRGGMPWRNVQTAVGESREVSRFVRDLLDVLRIKFFAEEKQRGEFADTEFKPDSLQGMVALDVLIQTATDMAIWPFDRKTFLRYAGLLISPLAPLFVEKLPAIVEGLRDYLHSP